VLSPLTKPGSTLAGCVAVAAALVGGARCQTHQRLVRQDEDVVVNDLRSLRSAEAAYEASNAGFPDVPGCLAGPQRCIPNYPKDAPPFLSTSLASLAEENGYVRAFHPGPAAPGVACPPQACSPSSLMAWAYTAVPIRDRRRRKSFCVDSTGRICALLDGKPPSVVEGRCPSPCERIQ
jgi:hypothetical protein